MIQALALILAAAAVQTTTAAVSSPDLAKAKASIAADPHAPASALLDAALAAWSVAKKRGEVTRDVAGVIDYSIPSTDERFWVLDLGSGTVLFHERVAHGKKSGENQATFFSDQEGSNASSIGAFVTRGTYQGKHGYSLKLDGLEKGWNANALEREIVIHGAWYVSADLAKKQGRIGRSWGCPAVSDTVSKDVIDAMKGGALLLGWYPDKKWLADSPYVAKE